MKLVCVANDVPWPPNTGGRVDVWRRLCALHAGGHEVSLLCWYDAGRTEPPSPQALEKLHEVCADLRVVPIRRSVGEIVSRAMNLIRMPSHAAARWVTAADDDLYRWARRAAPDAILLDGLYGGAVARWLAGRLDVPIVYRSHNVEHQYMRDQERRERRVLRRLGLIANRVGLKRFEHRVIGEAARVLDISLEDRAFWRGRGMAHVDWLPTAVDPEYARRITGPAAMGPIDVLYFGNLNTPNNVEAIRWLVCEVLPRIAQPNITVVLSGSRPAPEVRRLARRDPRVELIADPEDMAAVVAAASTIVNPMRAGSGVNLKSVEMIFSDASLVSTSVGVRGLPDEGKACFLIADDAGAFAAQIVRGLALGKRRDGRRDAARRLFSCTAAGEAIASVVAAIHDDRACGVAS